MIWVSFYSIPGVEKGTKGVLKNLKIGMTSFMIDPLELGQKKTSSADVAQVFFSFFLKESITLVPKAICL